MKKLSIILLLAISAACGLRAYAQKGAELLSAFAERTATFGKKQLNYREAITAEHDTVAPAIVIFLHGGSGAGSDNKRQMRSAAVGEIYNYLTEHGIKAYFLVPQCDEEASWSGFNPPPRRSGAPGPRMSRHKEPVKCESYNKYVKALADLYVEQHGADSTRIYIFGASMGGDGVWHIVNDYPTYFAAAMAASGAFRGKELPRVTHTPLLCIKGTRERTYTEYEQRLNRIKELGGEINFQPLKGLDHHDAIADAFTPARIEWVLTHRLKP